jgi:peptidoglycan/LPS O-acetylase OafA/YrhL
MTFRRIFQRQTSSGRAFIPEIDGLRFIAIFSVVIFHINAQMLRYYPTRFSSALALLLSHGDRGVRLFFVISGFILALPFARHHLQGGPRLSLKRYFLRRLTRLEPPYVASLLLLSALILLVLHERPSAVAAHLLASMTYCHNLVFGQLSSISPVAWSLEIEVQFYILVPLITMVFAVRRPILRRLVLAVIVILVGVLQTMLPGPLRWQLSIGYYLQFFLAGFILADLYLAATKARKQNWTWDAISFLGWHWYF